MPPSTPSLSMRDRLSHLTFTDACKLLGADGRRLLVRGGALALPAPDALRIADDAARVDWADGASAAIVFDAAVRGGLRLACTLCREHCVHKGGLLSLVLEHKTDLGLAAPPPEQSQGGAVSEEELVAQALADRAARAKEEAMTIVSSDPRRLWTDYRVTSATSGKTYRVALRGEERGVSYCSCPDFKTNTLGTCKHVMKVLARATRRFPPAARRRPYRRTRVTLHVRYGERPALAIALPHAPSAATKRIVRPYAKAKDLDAGDAMTMLRALEAAAEAFFVTPDAEELLDRRLVAARLASVVAQVRAAPAKHPLRKTLLREPLLPYQLDGIAFAAGAGRAILADEMGLGKTIQGVGVAELLAREVGIGKVLVVCPASLKAQWRSEIGRFSRRSAVVVAGPTAERADVYAGDAFFTICNYEQVLKDILHIEKTRWDLVILDEGQRIKNWEAKTTRVVKGLASRFALVLSGTPLENRIDDLYSVASFVDPHRLGPAFRFLHRHQRRDAAGKVVALRNLDELRARIAPMLLRRTRESVRLELPERNVEVVRIPPSAEQLELHDAHMRTVATIVRKSFLTEMDLLRLRAALLMCRMAANGTRLVDKKPPGWSTKLERLADLFEGIAAEADRKVVLFSEWTSMLDLIEPILRRQSLRFVRLDGSVPQKKRQDLVHAFQTDPKTRVFLTTNAGSTGLNLQAANTVINVDLPWNPAVLEQRIARAHRMGQTRPVHVMVLVTEGTIEENLLETLSTKRDVALATLDPSSNVSEIMMRSSSADLKERLERLLGKKPAAPIDETKREVEARAIAERRVTGERFLDAALALFPPDQQADVRLALDPKVVTGEDGAPRLSLAVPTHDRLASMLRGLADLLAPAAPLLPAPRRAPERAMN